MSGKMILGVVVIQKDLNGNICGNIDEQIDKRTDRQTDESMLR